MSAKGTYVYCLIASDRRPSLRSVPKGLPGTGAVRLLDVDSEKGAKRWLVVADAPFRQYNAEAINQRLQDLEWIARSAVAHERVVEAFSGAVAVLPMKLFTIFHDDRRALEDLASSRAHIDALVKRVANHEEWGVRLTLGSWRAPRARKPTHVGGRASGTEYLALKKSQRDRAVELTRRAHDVVAALYERLADLSSRAVRRNVASLSAAGGPLLLDAAYLVPRKQARRFRATAGREARSLAAEGYQLGISGPWPPYSFLAD